MNETRSERELAAVISARDNQTVQKHTSGAGAPAPCSHTQRLELSTPSLCQHRQRETAEMAVVWMGPFSAEANPKLGQQGKEEATRVPSKAEARDPGKEKEPRGMQCQVPPNQVVLPLRWGKRGTAQTTLRWGLLSPPERRHRE